MKRLDMMNNCAILLLTLSILALPLYTQAQSPIDTARGSVGQKLLLPVRLTEPLSSDVFMLSGTLILSNPTVFFPEAFNVPQGASLLASSLTRVNDSTYTFFCSVRRPAPNAINNNRDTVCFLAGEALAGSDSLCVVRFTKLVLGNRSIADVQGIILTRSFGTPLPYVRFAELGQSYPNPAPHGTLITWAYRIDKASEVVFDFYNVLGQRIVTVSDGVQPFGVHYFKLNPAVLFETFSTGAFWVQMRTNSGNVLQRFAIIE